MHLPHPFDSLPGHQVAMLDAEQPIIKDSEQGKSPNFYVQDK
jgi:hypothetical protein